MLRSRLSPLLHHSSTRAILRHNPPRLALQAYSIKTSRRLVPRPVPAIHAAQLARVFSTTTSTRQTKATIPPTPVPIGDSAKKDDHMDHSPKSELQTDLKKVSEMFGGTPEPALLAGMAGVLPYAGASVATLFLTWDINAATHTAHALKGQTASNAYLFDPETAAHWLEVLQPIQVGYGAVLLSFLGAIHWGLEFAGMGGHLGFRRYFLGILAPALAWPTILLPTNFALVCQFLGFTGMYYADSRATRFGWAPAWYNGYRFVLTFIVCTSIIFNLIVKEYLQDTGSTHGKLVNLKEMRKNMSKGAELGDRMEESEKQKKNMLKQGGKKTKKPKKKEEHDDDDEEHEEKPKKGKKDDDDDDEDKDKSKKGGKKDDDEE